MARASPNHPLSWQGDRIITTSATLIIAGETGSAPPFLQTIAARGFPTVALDLYSYFPFGESTFDVLHSSWAYTSGFTRQAIMEMYRVVRPGGYVIHTVWDKVARANGTPLLEEMAEVMGWRLMVRRDSHGNNATKDAPRETTTVVYQLPSYKYRP